MNAYQTLNRLYSLHKNFSYKDFYKSTKYFLGHSFYKNEYTVTFVSHNHFNRGENGENIFLLPFIHICDKYNIDYQIFEETSLDGKFSMYPRNKGAIPLDFISILKFILRKLLSRKNINYENYSNYYNREIKVSRIIKFLFFKKYKSQIYIILAHNNVELWRTINSTSLIADYQHGMIWNGHDNTLINSEASKIKVLNNLITLVYGRGFKQLLIKYDNSNFFNDSNVLIMGYHTSIPIFTQKENKKIILYTLQNVDLESNIEYYTSIKNLLYKNIDFLQKNNYKVLIKNHPRYNRKDKLKFETNLSFVSFIDDSISINDISQDISLHITSKSTTTFDLALQGIPTIFTNFLTTRSPIEMFKNQYQYPLEEYIINNPNQLKDILLSLEDKKQYQQASLRVYNWAKDYYNNFDERKFLELIKKVSSHDK